MKIINYIHTPEKIVIDKNGEPKVIKGKTQKLFFALTHEAYRIFEELYGKPLFEAMFEFGFDGDNKADKEKLAMQIINNKVFIMSLAAASNLRITNGEYCNSNMAANKLMEIDGINDLANNLDFVMQLIELVVGAVPKPKNNGKGRKNNYKNTKKKY